MSEVPVLSPLPFQRGGAHNLLPLQADGLALRYGLALHCGFAGRQAAKQSLTVPPEKTG